MTELLTGSITGGTIVGIMRLDVGVGASISNWGGTTLSLQQLEKGTVTLVSGLTNGSVNLLTGSLTNGSINVLTGTVTNVGTNVGMGTLSNIGSVNTVTNLTTVTTVSNLTNGSLRM